jgi:flagella basal body P-ring formation protein FlgA
LRSALEREDIVRIGDPVQLMINGEGFSVSVKGIAQGRGAIGDTVTVKNQRSEKLVSGVVVSRGVVHAQF